MNCDCKRVLNVLKRRVSVSFAELTQGLGGYGGRTALAVETLLEDGLIEELETGYYSATEAGHAF